jgi:hypothetical protein
MAQVESSSLPLGLELQVNTVCVSCGIENERHIYLTPSDSVTIPLILILLTEIPLNRKQIIMKVLILAGSAAKRTKYEFKNR